MGALAGGGGGAAVLPPALPVMGGNRYLERALASGLDAVRGAPDGERNATLRREGVALGGFVPRVDAARLVEALVAAAVASGLPATEARATASRAVRDGAREPRTIPGADGRRWRGGMRIPRRPSSTSTSSPDVDFEPPADVRAALVDLWRETSATSSPTALEPPESARAVLVDLWRAVEGDVLPPAACEWCEGRRIDPDVAWSAGCRVPSREVLEELLSTHGREALESAGLWRPGGDGRPGRVAWEWGDGEPPRLWMPVWSPVWMDAPVAYRWRAVHAGAKAKALGPRLEAWRDWPLGVHWPIVWRPSATSSAPVVIVEGEPDWLTVAGALEPSARVLCMPGTAGWRSHWCGMLRAASALIVAVHDDGAGQRAAESIGRAVAELWPVPAGRPTIAKVCPPAGGDWNDAVQASGSAGLAELVEVVRYLMDREEA